MIAAWNFPKQLSLSLSTALSMVPSYSPTNFTLTSSYLQGSLRQHQQRLRLSSFSTTSNGIASHVSTPGDLLERNHNNNHNDKKISPPSPSDSLQASFPAPTPPTTTFQKPIPSSPSSSTARTTIAVHGLVKQWMQLHNRLLSQPVGTLTSLQWEQAQVLLKDLRRLVPQQQQQEQQQLLLQHGFVLMDRLQQEMEHGQNTSATTNSPSSRPSPNLRPLKMGVWRAPLLAWRDSILSTNSITTTTTTSMPITAQPSSALHPLQQPPPPPSSQGVDANNNNDFPSLSSSSSPFHLWTVLSKVQGYLDAGLFEPHPSLYSIVLDALFKLLSDNKNTKMNKSENCPYQRAHEEIYEKMLQQSDRNPWNVLHHPDSSTIYHLMQIWSTYPNSQTRMLSTTRAEAYFQSLKQWYQACPRPELKPTPFLYCALMETYCNSCSTHYHPTGTAFLLNPQLAFGRIQELYAEMKEQLDDDDEEEWTELTYNRICHALVNCRVPESPEAARAILEELCQRYLQEYQQQQQQQQPKIASYGNKTPPAPTRQRRPFPLTEYPFSIVMTAYGRAGRPQEAQALLEYMTDLADQTNNPALRPSAMTYNTLIWAFAQVGDHQGAEAALMRFVEAMDQGHVVSGRFVIDLKRPPESDSNSSGLYEHGSKGNNTTNKTGGSSTTGHETSQSQQPLNTLEVWNGVLASWALSDDPNAPAYIESVIERLETMSRNSHNNGSEPQSSSSHMGLTTSTYNTLLTCYARRGTIEAAQQAEALIHKMESNQHARSDQKPDANSYLNLIMAWSNAGRPEQSEQWLQTLCQRAPSSLSSLLTNQHFNVVIEAWVKVAHQHPQALERATAIMDYMKSQGYFPDSFTYTSLMWAWAKSNNTRDPAKPVEQLFRQMMQQYKDQEQQQQQLNIMGTKAPAIIIKPDTVSYNAVLHALARSPDPTAIDRVLALWQEIKNHGIKPNAKLYNTLLSVYSRRNQPQQTEQVFQEFLQLYHETVRRNGLQAPSTADVEALRPEARAYNSRLQVWSKVGDPEQTAQVLREWITAYDQGIVQDSLPTTKHFNAVLHAWLRHNHPESARKAEAGLRQMIQLATRTTTNRQFDCHPDTISYASVIAAFAASNLPEAGDKSFELLNELKKLVQNNKRNGNGLANKNDSDSDELSHPSFRTYAQVLQALCRSAVFNAAAGATSNHSRYQLNSNAAESKARAVYRLHLLFDELLAKSPLFWQQQQKQQPNLDNQGGRHPYIRMIQDALHSSAATALSAQDLSVLLAKLEQLEHNARQVRGVQGRRSYNQHESNAIATDKRL
ncbi:hypothetical protein ACA910_010915 [Epithemia clementina (nom. ined.)]